MKYIQRLWQFYCQKIRGIVVTKELNKAIITVYHNKKKVPSLKETLTTLKDVPNVDIIYTPELERDL